MKALQVQARALPKVHMVIRKMACPFCGATENGPNGPERAGDPQPLRCMPRDLDEAISLIAGDAVFRIPARNAISGTHCGHDGILRYWRRQIERSKGTLRTEVMRPRCVATTSSSRSMSAGTRTMARVSPGGGPNTG